MCGGRAVAYSFFIAVGASGAAFAETATEEALSEELMRLMASESVHEKRKKVDLVDATVKVVPLEIGKDFENSPQTFPRSATDVTIKDGNFHRRGKPVFLFGVTGRMYDGSWLLRMLGVDFEVLTVTTKASFRQAVSMEKEEGPGGRPHLTLSVVHDDPWGGARVHEMLRGGTLAVVDYHFSMSSFRPLPYLTYRFRPMFYAPHLDGWRKTSSHFLDLNLENPEAAQLYKNMLRWGNRRFREYPVFFHEMVDEVSYVNPSPRNIRLFQEAMTEKFGTIEEANAAWKTGFRSFSKVIPPINVCSGSMYDSPWGVIPHGKDLSNGLWVDWIKFMQTRVVAAFSDLVADYKAHNPGALCAFEKCYWTGINAQTPRAMGAVEDLYDHEAALTLKKVERGEEDWGKVREMLVMSLGYDLIRGVIDPRKAILNPGGCPLVGQPKEEYVIGPAGVRTLFWNQAVHGAGGFAISWFYSQATSAGGTSPWDPRLMRIAAVREFPRAKNEIESVAEIVLPRPRIKGRAVMLFSHETARLLRPEDRLARYRMFIPETCGIYGPALFTGVPLDVIDNEGLLRGDLKGHSVLILARATRVLPGTLEKLTRYVSSGGTLVVSCDSLKTDDEWHTPLDASRLLGGKVGACVERGEKVRFDVAGLGDCSTVGLVASPADGVEDFEKTVHGFRFRPSSARVLARAGAEAAFSVNSVGRGKVYYMSREFDVAAMCRVFKWIMKEAGETPDVEVELADGLKTNYVETHIFARGGHAVVYAMNWGGGPRRARLRVRGGISGGSFLVRELRTRRRVRPDGSAGRAEWTRADLERGIPAELPMHDPILFVVDEAARGELTLKSLPAEQEEALSWMWRESPRSKRRVLFDVMYTMEGHVHGYKMPTAAKLLEDKGYQVEYLVQPVRKMRVRTADKVRAAQLSDYNVFIISGAHGKSELEEADLKKIEEYVRRGGGLLYCAFRDWHVGPAQKILQRFGVEVAYSYFYDEDNCIADEPLWVTFNNIAAHPITKGVASVQSMGARPVRGEGAAVVRSGPNSYTFHPWGESRRGGPQAIVHALEVGKGRVVVIGTDVLFRPDDLEMADNRRLFENTIDWLAEPSLRE